MNTWIFQSKPQEFRLKDFLNSSPRRALWRASRHAEKMKIGDEVYIWQAIGKGQRSMSGVFGRGVIEELPFERNDDSASRQHWNKAKHATDIIMRAMIAIEKSATNPIIPREKFERDLLLKFSSIMTYKRGSNFKLTSVQASRVREIWPE